MAYIKKNKDYYYLAEGVWENGKAKQKHLFYMGKKLVIPRRIIREYRISRENVDRLRKKYPGLRIVNE